MHKFYSFIYLHPWDLLNGNAEKVFEKIAGWGINGINIATSYHAGYFLHSHNPDHKMYLAEDGVVYFPPNERFFQTTSIKPRQAQISKNFDCIGKAQQLCSKFGLKMMSWTVCNHNTPLGLKNPEHTITNIFGDSYPHALCPSSKQVRTYVRGMCKNIATDYDFDSIVLEANDFRGIPHGHHHERYGTILRSLEESLMSLCFCQWCIDLSNKNGLDLIAISQNIRKHMEVFFNESPIFPANLPSNLNQMLDSYPKLIDMIGFRQDVESSLVRDIKTDLKQIGSTSLLAQSSFRNDYSPNIDGFVVSCYGNSIDEITKKITHQRNISGSKKLFAGIRTGFGEVLSQNTLAEMVISVQKSGGDGIGFYNYSETPIKVLNWIEPALDQFR